MPRNATSIINTASSYAHLVVPLAAVVILLVLLVPLPPILLDILISFNLMLSIILLLVSMYILEPVEFTTFPTLLLLTTLYRLSLNVATARLILLNGEMGESAAGSVIKAFGEFVIGGNFVVGLVIFILLLVIQFVVVNHGAVRASEVMARFTLDAMPGKQMAVDADLAAGIIDEHQAKKRREEISQASEFHGAMDGAIRFTQRDAVASILITFINIIGGFAVGVLQHNLGIAEAAKTYTILTVGDGVAAAVPSLFVSVAAAVVTTRATRQSSMGDIVSAQLLINPKPIFITSGVLAFLGLLPGMPHIPFLLLASATAGIAYLSEKNQQNSKMQEESATAQVEESATTQLEPTEGLLKLDTLALEVGYGLIPLVGSNNAFINRIKEIRRQIALELGIIVPSVHVTDNLQIAPKEYTILLKGNRIARAELKTDSFMAIDPGIVREQIEGIPTTDPAFGMPAIWIRDELKEKAIAAGYTVVDPITVICTHFSEVIKEHVFELLGRQETRALLDELAKTYPKTVEETIPKVLSLGEIQRVLQNLLKERIPIRDLVTILETIADTGTMTRDVNILTENARIALSRTICNRLATDNDELIVLSIDPVFESHLVEKLGLTGNGVKSAIEPDFARNLLERIEFMVESTMLGQPILLCSAILRPHLKKLTARFLPNLSVIAHSEIASNIKLVSVGIIK
ncbi:MAG: flagellar biosynthesis protein FlhA [Blastocatellia bacterium]